MYISALQQETIIWSIYVAGYTLFAILFALFSPWSLRYTWPVFLPITIPAIRAISWLIKKFRRNVTAFYAERQRRKQEALELKLKRYMRLDSLQNEIRLVVIRPGKLQDPIECELQPQSLDDVENAVAYEALSYTWGSVFGSKVIQLNGHPCQVRKNLYQALRQLRQPTKPRFMWIDALCINQFDNAERSAQVAMMRYIYQRSLRVIVWLGETDRNSKAAFKFLQLVDKNAKKKEFLRETIGNYDHLNGWKCLRKLYKRPYWNRIWIIQEIAAAPFITVQCGPDSVGWRTLVMSDIAWRHKRVTQDWKLSEWFNTVEKENGPFGTLHMLGLVPGPSILDTTRRTFSNELTAEEESPSLEIVSNSHSKNTILELIQTYWTSQSTDPKDRIYALVGLASDCDSENFKMNYDWSLIQVHMELVRYLKNSASRLDILGYAGLIEDRSQEGYWITQDGSWLPTWTAEIPSKQLLSKINMRNRYSAAGISQANAEIKQKRPECWSNRLNISGCTVGTMHKLGPKLDFSSWTFTKDDLGRVTREIKKCFDFAQQVRQSIRAELPFHGISESRLDDNLTNFWRVLVCDRTIDGAQAPEGWKEQFNDLVFNAPDRPNLHFRAHVRPYQLAVLNCMNNRQLFVTTNGDFGVGPPSLSTANGDDIVVFYGCNVPMAHGKWRGMRNESLPERLLRKLRRSCWHTEGCSIDLEAGQQEGEKVIDMELARSKGYLQGWTYLQNYMAGEAMEEIDRGQLKEQVYSLI